MVAVKVTPDIRAILTSAKLSHRTTRTSDIETVSHKTLCEALRQQSDSHSLHDLLSNTSIHLSHQDAVPFTPSPNPELEARLQKLRSRQADAEYARMTRDVSRASGTTAELESLRMSKLAPQMSLGFNIIVTMATCFAAGYFVARGASGNETLGLIGGVGGMIIAMFVEGILLGIRMYTIEDKASEERRHRLKLAR